MRGCRPPDRTRFSWTAQCLSTVLFDAISRRFRVSHRWLGIHYTDCRLWPVLAKTFLEFWLLKEMLRIRSSLFMIYAPASLFMLLAYLLMNCSMFMFS